MKKPRANQHGASSKPSELFSSFLRGASCLKSPRTQKQSETLSRAPEGRQELFQLVSGGISRLENDGSAVFAEL